MLSYLDISEIHVNVLFICTLIMMLMHLNNLIAMYKNYANYDIEGILLFELSTLHHTLYTRYSIFNCTPLTSDMHPFYYNGGVEGILKVEGGGLDYSETVILTSKKRRK